MPLLLRHARDKINHAAEGEAEPLEVARFMTFVPSAVAINDLNVEAHAKVSCGKWPEARGKASILKNCARPPEDSLVTTFNVSVRLVDTRVDFPWGKPKSSTALINSSLLSV